MPTAILVDGGFFLRRFRRVYLQTDSRDPPTVARTLHQMALDHLVQGREGRKELYRILFYDCAPLKRKSHHPLTGEVVDFRMIPGSAFRLAFHEKLKKLRKVALRLGYLRDGDRWIIRAGTRKIRVILHAKRLSVSRIITLLGGSTGDALQCPSPYSC
jgi:uncharacterized LabA/DUF88 family protein